MILIKQYRCIHSASCKCTKGHLTEEVIFLLYQRLNWNPKFIATLSCVCKWFDDLAKRVLWKEFCKTRAPKMMLDLQSNGSHSVDGNRRALGSYLFTVQDVAGLACSMTFIFLVTWFTEPVFLGHQGKAFFCLNAGQMFCMCLTLVNILTQGEEGDVGFFRGVIKSFAMSNVRKMLIRRGAQLHPTEFCPYCKAKLWSMLQASMIPQSASCRLGAYEDCIDYYVCLNGHVLGICTLLPLSDSDEASELE